MHIFNVKLPFYPPYEVKYGLQNRVSTVSPSAWVRGPYNALVLSKTFVYSPVVGFPIDLSLRTVQCPGSVQNFCFFSSSWFPYRLESEDHTMPWFCPKPLYFSQVAGFPVGLRPRSIQCLGSVQNLYFFSGSWFPHRLESEEHTMPWLFPKPLLFSQVVGFPISLSPGTIQCFGSIQNLCFFSGSWFPHRLETEDHTIPWFCQKPLFFFSSSWFLHRLQSKDHTMPWLCRKTLFFLSGNWFPHRLESEDHTMPWFCQKPLFILR